MSFSALQGTDPARRILISSCQKYLCPDRAIYGRSRQCPADADRNIRFFKGFGGAEVRLSEIAGSSMVLHLTH